MGTKGTTYLGIDGGGTRCRARIEDENGSVLGAASSGPATTRIGFEKAWRSIMEATEAAAAQAGLTLNPGFTVRRFRAARFSDNPNFLAGRERMYEGLRMAGVPEG